MALVGFADLIHLTNFEVGLSVLKAVPYGNFTDYNLSVVPLFILMS